MIVIQESWFWIKSLGCEVEKEPMIEIYEDGKRTRVLFKIK